jgi:hypothetical protein
MRGMGEANLQPSEDICEVCGQPAETHTTTIDKAGHVSVRHVCLEHSLSEPFLARMTEQMRARWKRNIDDLRRPRDDD